MEGGKEGLGNTVHFDQLVHCPYACNGLSHTEARNGDSLEISHLG